jgi:hypothetical protein
MSFKRFDTEDIVVSSDSISSPAWSNNLVNLTGAGLESDADQISANSGNYYHNIYVTSSRDEVQFSVAYGHLQGSGSLLYNSSVLDRSYSKTVYGQFRTLLNGDEDTNFQFDTSTPKNVYFISVERARFKEKILPGSLTLNIGTVSSNINLTDNGVSASVDTFKDGGREYLIYQGSQGSVTSTSTVYGKIYPDTGIIVLDGDRLASEGYIIAPDESNNPTNSNIPNLYNNIRNFSLRSEETISSNYIFIRARNSEFNYSTNPSNITGSGELQHSTMIDTPQAYITAVGLYNDNNDLLAVSKLSKPLLKDFNKEALIRIKLDY